MPDIIDVSMACGAQAGFLAGAGVKTIIRYYSRDTGIPAKRLGRPEAEALAGAGLRLGIVHEARHGNQPSAFSQDLGVKDATYVMDYASRIIRQPFGTAIYFGVDFDASTAQVTQLIKPYFQGLASVLHGAAAGSYRIGVYGSGRTCQALSDADLVEFTWLAQSTGWSGYRDYKQSKTWTLLQAMPAKVGEVECDPDTRAADGRDIGDFALDGAAAPTHADAGATDRMKVIAGPGLRLRAGPGTDFDIIGLVPKDAIVTVSKVVGDWSLVDTDGDGAPDGFVNSHFLA